jgi:hypothetical protein
MKWEYKTIKISTTGFLGGKFDENQFDSMMNDLGAQGWEFTAAFDTNQGHGATRDVVAVFKRERR